MWRVVCYSEQHAWADPYVRPKILAGVILGRLLWGIGYGKGSAPLVKSYRTLADLGSDDRFNSEEGRAAPGMFVQPQRCRAATGEVDEA
jgi:hypothetical protein